MLNPALKVLRTYHTMQQNVLAEKLNISSSFLCELEAGRKLPNLKLLQKYSSIFDIPIVDIFFLQDMIENNDNAINGKVFTIMGWFREQKVK